ncbi:MAG: tetratricopeptide repeat protein [Pseudomonadota bacterium]
MTIVFRGAVLGLCLIALSACDSSEERAEKHYQNGLELLETGDVARALLEFRNTLALDEAHRDARLVYARTARENGNMPEAYSAFLRLAESAPDDVESRLALSEIAIASQNWEEAERHGAKLAENAADLEGADIVALALAFRTAAIAEERPVLRELTRQAEVLAQASPQNEILSRMLIEGYLTENRTDDAIAVTADILETNPENPAFYQIMAELLIAKGDTDGLETHFRAMLERFPNDTETKGNLIRLLVSEGRGPQAEDFLREEIARSDTPMDTHVSLIALIRQLRGDVAALEEIETAINAYENNGLLVALKAGLIFDRGDRDQAIALMQSITDGQEPGMEVNEFRVTLAKMLIAEGNEVGARQLVGAVLENDASQVEALKLQANWQIAADEADAAIANLRIALDRAPNDAEAMTIMARAHERNGATQLAQDLLALAVEASGNAPAESLRFARVQMGEERYRSAEDTLITALRRAPNQPDLLNALGQVYVATSDWGRAEQVMQSLRRSDDELARLAAEDLQLQIISLRDGREEGIEFLEGLAGSGTDPTAVAVALIQAKLQEDAGDEALSLAEQLVTDNPGLPGAALVLGNTHLALGDLPKAEETFRTVLATDSANTAAVMQLLRTLSLQDRTDDAEAALDSALAVQPENPDLLWAKASFLEQANDIDGAIGVYEKLYAQNTNNNVVANNLASLLVTYRDDDASLQRAAVVGRRLRDTDVPPFQDTYGWLLYRQGLLDEAVSYLEPAARALRSDPIVQFHLGKAYLALGRDADAKAQFEKMLALVEPSDPRLQVAEAREEVSRLSVATE